MIVQELEGRQDYELYSKQELSKTKIKPNLKKALLELMMHAFDNGTKLGQGKKIEVTLYEHD